jgi:hypothetical protein
MRARERDAERDAERDFAIYIYIAQKNFIAV